MTDYEDRKNELEELAFIDNSAMYEIDETGIYRDPATGKFLVLQASGCSCWDGEYDEEQYDTLDALEKGLEAMARRFYISLEGVKELIAAAKAKV